MGEERDHNAVLRAAAKEVLRPMGLTQQGRSRTWFDDRTWHIIVVEFQPSSWSKGSYLNVGAMFLWHPKDYLSFDYGHRVREFERADQPDWHTRSRARAEAAARRVGELRGELADLETTARVLAADITNSGWPLFSAAIAQALVGRMDRARSLFDMLLAGPAEFDWVRDMHARAAQYRSLLAEPNRFCAAIAESIHECRRALKLRESSEDEILDSLG